MKRYVVALLAALLLSVTLVQAQTESKVASTYRIEQVAPGVHAFISAESRTGVVNGNTTLIVGDDGALVVDSGQMIHLAGRMIADIKRITDKPVRYLVNTHWHGDHVLANCEYKKAFPGLQIVMHPETARLGHKNYTKFLREWPTQRKEIMKTLQDRFASGKRRDGTSLTEQDREYINATIADIEAGGDFSGVTIEPPAMTFTDAMTVYLGSREVRLLHLGRANTGGDVQVYVPDAKVLMTGDTVVAPTPYSFGSFHSEWIAVLDKILAMDTVAIVPGHGPVMRDKSYVQTVRDLLVTTRDQVRAAVAQGLSLEDTRKKVDLVNFRKKMAGDDYFRGRAFDDFYLQPGIERAYKEAKGEKLDEDEVM